jgi:hypothetical protein
MEPINVTIVAKKIDGKFEGAFLVGNRFTRVITGSDLAQLVTNQILKVLNTDFPEGVDVAVNVNVVEDDTIQEKKE